MSFWIFWIKSDTKRKLYRLITANFIFFFLLIFFSFASGIFVNHSSKLIFLCSKILAQVIHLRWQWHILPGKAKSCLKLLANFFTESYTITLSFCSCKICCNSSPCFCLSYSCSVPSLYCIFQQIFCNLIECILDVFNEIYVLVLSWVDWLADL
jgi:hypothetical protein